MTITGTYFVFPSESKLNIDSTGGIVKIILPTEESVNDYADKVGGIIPEIISYNIIGATINPVRFYRGGDKLWNGGAQYIEVITDGDGTISSQDGIQSIINSGSGGSPSFNNPFDFYLDSTVSVGGDGSLESPFKTITELNNAVIALANPSQSYIANIAPSNTGYGSEVIGSLLLAPNLSLVGQTPQNTGIECNINLVATATQIVNQYRNLAFNGIFTIDFSLASFATVSFQNGVVNINRIDSNPSSFVALNSGIGGATLSGTVLIQNGVMLGDVTINDGANVYAVNTFILNGKFKLNGNCTLKTLSTLNPSPDYVDGTVNISGTPTWLTDAASDESYTGTLNKTVY